MYSNKVKIAADIHLCQNYYEYLRPTLEAFIADVERERPVITVIAGDYFDRRIYTDDFIYKKAIDYLLQLAKSTKHLVVVQGTYSHDYDSLNILNSIKTIQDNIIFTKDIAELELEGYKILCIPEAYPKDPNEYYRKYLTKEYDFVFGHGDIEGAVLHAGIDNTKLNGFKFSPLSLSKMARFVVFGHIHKHQFLKENVCYPGSLGRWKYGEEEDKGYVEIDLDLNLMKFVPLDSYTFDTVIIKSKEDLEKLKADLASEGATNNNLRIRISEDLKDLKNGFLEEEFLKDLNNKYKFEYLKEEYDDSDALIYGEISKLSLREQYFKMFEFEKDNKKIPKKKLDEFLSDENFNARVGDIIFEVSNKGDEGEQPPAFFRQFLAG